MNRTPHEHAVKRGHYVEQNPLTPQNKAHYKMQHAVADKLHGWTKDAYHYQAPGDAFTLSDEDYEAAVSAAMTNRPAHPPAVAANYRETK